MRYSLTFHQLGLVENGLEDLPLQAALLLDYLNGFYFSGPKIKRIEIEGEEFAWIDLKTAADDLPMFVPSKLGKKAIIEKLSRLISCLRNFNLISTRRGDSGRLHYRLTPLAASILVSSKAPSPSCGIPQEGGGILAENRKGDLRNSARRNAPGNIREQYNNNIPPISPKGHSDDFEIFWKNYPKKVKKPAAFLKWKSTSKDRPPLAKLLSSLQSASRSDNWNKQNGQYIPNPSTWLQNHSWNDFEPVSTESEDVGSPEPSGWREIHLQFFPDRDIPRQWGNVSPTVQDGLREECAKSKTSANL